MKLSALIAEIALIGEQAADRVRHKYITNLEQLQAQDSDLEGVDSKLNVTPLSTLMPEEIKHTVMVALSIDKDGDIDAALTWDGKNKEHWWSRPRRQSVAEIEIKWRAHEPPEGVCRIRDDLDDRVSQELRLTKAKRNREIEERLKQGETHG